MARDSINIIERHVDKVVLGIGGAFALAMLWMYLIQSPNQVDYQGGTVGPRELDEKVLSAAQTLKNRVANARPPEVTVTRYSDTLRKSIDSGLFAASDTAPPLPEQLPLVTSFGKPISIEGLEEFEGGTDIKLVTPLPPQRPKVITGRSVAVRVPPTAPGQPPPPASDKQPEAAEFPWVSLAAYFPTDAQRDEMTKARYAAYRTKVYMAGVDAQRQEMLSTGEFSEWQDVTGAKAQADFKIPEPIFDDQSGAMVNKEAVEQAYQAVRESQQLLVQPPFFAVEVGDEWEIPPIEGYEPKKVEDAPPPKGKPTVDELRQAPTRGRPSPPPTRGGNRGGGGPDVVISGEGARPSAPVVNTEAQQRREASKRIREDMLEARKAFKQKDYQRAGQLVNQVMNDQYANRGQQNQAKQLMKAIEKIANKLATPQAREQLPFITHPEKADLVPVWFHDDTVEPGKTYRYRLRVNLWNRYVGQLQSVANPQEAKQSIVHGEWSEPSEPISVTPSTYFFLANAAFDKSEAFVEIFKWRSGEWIKERFGVRVGDTIGGVKNVTTSDFDEDAKPLRVDMDFNTGAVVLDLRYDEPVPVRTSAGKKGEFTYRTQETLVMTYLEPADGQVKERVLAVDRHNPIKKKLEDEY